LSLGNVNSRRLDIQGLRAIAVIFVLLHHSGIPIHGGFVGVDIFFVISGYVITSMLFKEFQLKGSISLRAFYSRRFRRLVPALSFVILVTLFLSLLLESPLGAQQRTAKTAVGAITFSANIVIAGISGGYFNPPAEVNPLLHTWSLSVEEQFYLLFPLLFFCGIFLRKRHPLSILKICVCIVGVVSFTAAVLGSNGLSFIGIDPLLGFYSPVTRAWEFAVGSFLALRKRSIQLDRMRLASLKCFGILGCFMLFLSLFVIDESTSFPGFATLIPVFGTLLLIEAGPGNGFITRILKTSPFVKVGDLSYSIYLWHWPLISLTNSLYPDQPSFRVIAALVSLAPATLSFHFIERPIRENRMNSLLSNSTLAFVVFIPVALLAIGLYLFSEFQLKPRFESKLQPTQIVYELGCHWDGGSDPIPCRWNKNSKRRPVYLLGDSNAAHFSEGLIKATRELGRPLVSNTSSGCPLLLLEIEFNNNPMRAKECYARNQRLLRWIQDQKQGTVVLSMSDEYFLSEKYSIKSPSEKFSSDAFQKTDLMEIALSNTLSFLENSGHDVVMIQTVPHFVDDYAWKGGECPGFPLWSEPCSKVMPRKYSLKKSKEIVARLKIISSGYGVKFIDFSPIVCPNDKCTVSSFLGSGYQDASHISVDMDKSLASEWLRILRQET
jgi:peptidoglycan/LPS O-acetylase OafA/YrhL